MSIHACMHVCKNMHIHFLCVCTDACMDVCMRILSVSKGKDVRTYVCMICIYDLFVLM
jgi:hypothetical protein